MLVAQHPFVYLVQFLILAFGTSSPAEEEAFVFLSILIDKDGLEVGKLRFQTRGYFLHLCWPVTCALGQRPTQLFECVKIAVFIFILLNLRNPLDKVVQSRLHGLVVLRLGEIREFVDNFPLHRFKFLIKLLRF